MTGVQTCALPIFCFHSSTVTALYEIVPGVIVATVAIVVVSLIGRAPSPALQAQHEQVRRTLREHGC